MDKHFTVLGALFLALGLMGLLGMSAVLLIFSIGGAAVGLVAAQESDVPALLALLPVSFGLFLGLAIAVGAVPSLVAAYGLLQRRRWAAPWALVAGILNLPNLPLGTGIGVYALWVYTRMERTAH